MTTSDCEFVAHRGAKSHPTPTDIGRRIRCAGPARHGLGRPRTKAAVHESGCVTRRLVGSAPRPCFGIGGFKVVATRNEEDRERKRQVRRDLQLWRRAAPIAHARVGPQG